MTTSFTSALRKAATGNQLSLNNLWLRCHKRLTNIAGRILRRYGVNSVQAEEIASDVFMECVNWNAEKPGEIPGQREFWFLLSRATVFRARNILRRETLERRRNLKVNHPLPDNLVDSDSDVGQILLQEEFQDLLARHPLAAVVFPMLIDQQPIDVIARKLQVSRRSAYRIVAQLDQELKDRLYD